MNHELLLALSSLVSVSAPLIYAGIGETLTEKAGVINLSLDGSILLAAMGAFAVAYLSGSLVLGFLAAAIIGAAIAGLIAFASITLRQDQVAVGFVLTLLCADLSSFLGNPFVHKRGPSVPSMPIPLLKDIPLAGPLFFAQDPVVYGSFLLIIVSWWWMFKTQPGLRLQGIGERPEAAFARGTNVNRLRYLYTIAGGALVGIAGAAYSLDIKLGWSHNHTAGNGWIALAIVIFGGWHPARVAFGAYLFGGLKSVGSVMQRVAPAVPTQIFQAAPFALMIVVLVLVSGNVLDRLLAYLPPRARRRVLDLVGSSPPAAIGIPFIEDS